MSRLTLSNQTARSLWLARHGLYEAPTGPLNIARIGADLGFVQLDSIRHVERAHDHILWSRNQTYRPGGLDKALKRREFFEHFTHDASLIPMQFLPMWQRQFRRRAEKIVQAGWWKNMPDAAGRAEIKARIAAEGPLSTKDFQSKGPRPKEMWHRPPHKLALDFMWYAGELATCHRENFIKFYDLSERVFPPELHHEKHGDSKQIDMLCRTALARLGFASAGDIQRFWDACSAAEVRAWLAASKAELVEVLVELADKSTVSLWALPEIEDQILSLEKPPQRMRLLNPFDPAIRDRTRAFRLFGFDYSNEIFVPEAKRKWGYYVYPILEGTSFVGRVALKADRKAGTLRVDQLWPEEGVNWGAQRQKRWLAELGRFAKFAGLEPTAN